MPRQSWGEPDGVPEGSDFTLEAVLTLDGALAPTRVTSSGAFTMTVSDSILNGGTALLTDETSDSVVASVGLVKWNITDTQSDNWEAGTYHGDIKLVDSGGSITYWPVSLKVRAAKD